MTQATAIRDIVERARTRFRPPIPPEQGPAPRHAGPVAMAVWFGLVTGLLELALMLVRKRFINAAALGLLQMNRHAVWMIPVSDLLIFGACGLVLGALALIRPRPVRIAAVFGLSFLSAMALLSTFRGLTAMAYIALSGGIGSVLARWIVTHPRGFRRLVAYTVPALAAIVAGLVAVDLGRAASAEHRTLAALPRPAAGTPNVLFVVLDTVGAESLHLYGYHRNTSPRLEAIARGGVRFDRARSAASWTLPSHASMFTARWPHELSARLDRPLDSAFPTLAEYLRDRGYATAGFVANTFFCNAWYGLGRGFVHYEDSAITAVEILRSSGLGRRIVKRAVDSPHDRPGAYFRRKDAVTINRTLLDWLDGRPKDRPFFAFLNYYDAHDPYLTPVEPARRFGRAPRTAAELATLRNWHRVDKHKPTPDEVALARDCFDDCIAYLDEQVGRLFDTLGRRGLLENTVVVITADHGEEFGEHGKYGHGLSLHREVIHVPLLILAPSRVPAGREVDAPASLRDLPATVVDLVGLRDGSPFPGRSLAAHWSGAAGSAADPAGPVLTEIVDREPHEPAGWKPPRALVADEALYIRDGDGREKLYDLQSDPSESHDLAAFADSRPRIERFRALLAPIDRDDPATSAGPDARTKSDSR